MKNKILVIIFIFLSNVFYSQDCFFPPELKYWTCEIQTIIPNFSPKNFVINEVYSIGWDDFENIDLSLTYPVFYKWNYSGTYFAYHFGGDSLESKQEKYKVVNNKEGFLYISDRNKANIIIDFDEFYINNYIWLRDDILIAVGYKEADNNNYFLIYRKYSFIKNKNDNISFNVEEYRYKESINKNEINKVKLNWYENRMDYFEE